MRRLRHILLAVLVLALAAPVVAQAGYKDVIRDCSQDGKLDHTYSRHDLDQARRHMPTDLNEYTDCSSAIANALARRSGGGGTGSPPANPAYTTAAGASAYNQQDFNTLKSQAQSDRKSKNAPKVAIGANDIAAGGSSVALLRDAAAANKVPTSLLLPLIAVGCLTLVGTSLLLTRRWPAARRVALRVFHR